MRTSITAAATTRRVVAAVLAIAVGWVAVGYIRRAIDPGRPAGVVAPYPEGLIGQLSSLRADDGLFRSPASSARGVADPITTAYANAIVQAAGQDGVHLNRGERLQSAVAAAVKQEPFWAAWAVSVLAADLLPTSTVDPPSPSSDPAANIGLTSAYAEISCPPGRPCSPEVLHLTTTRLVRDLAAVSAAYPIWRARDTLSRLAVDVGPAPELPLPTQLSSTEDFLDLFGAVALRRQLTDADRERVLRLLRPLLRAPIEGNELEASYVARTWRLAGGPAEELANYRDQVLARIDPATGLVTAAVRIAGTLENTYQVSRLLGLDLPRVATGATAVAVRAELAKAPGDEAGLVHRMECLVILRRLGVPDVGAEGAGVKAAKAALGRPVTRDRVRLAHTLVRLTSELQQDLGGLTAVPFAIATPEDEFLALTLLGDLRSYANSSEVRTYYESLVARIPTALQADAPTSVLVALSRATYATAPSVSGPTLDVLQAAAQHVRGCDGFPDLFRPDRQAGVCLLDVSADLFQLGLAYG